MGGKRHTAEQIISTLRQIEIAREQGSELTVAAACRGVRVSAHTYCRWRRDYGGMQVNQAKMVKALEKENARPQKLPADQVLDNAPLREVAWGNSQTRRPSAAPLYEPKTGRKLPSVA